MSCIINRQRHRAALLFCLLSFFYLLSPHAAPGDKIGEYEIKGAMIANFIRFSTWPTPDIETRKTDFVVGIMGDHAPFDAFSPMQGLRVGDKHLSVRHIDSLYEIPECRVLFVDKSQRYRVTEIMDAVDGLPILTIGESDNFIQTGGLICFYLHNGHIKFEINGKAAAKSPVRISSKLMEIGKIIY